MGRSKKCAARPSVSNGPRGAGTHLRERSGKEEKKKRAGEDTQDNYVIPSASAPKAAPVPKAKSPGETALDTSPTNVLREAMAVMGIAITSPQKPGKANVRKRLGEEVVKRRMADEEVYLLMQKAGYCPK